MSMTIWKYPLRIAAPFEASMPYGAEVLTADMQGGQPCMWVLVDADNSEEMRGFVIVGTGHPAPVRGYLCTFQQPPFVWHLFEVALE